MKIHEYQAKELMAARGIAVPQGRVATTVEEAVAAVRPLIEARSHALELDFPTWRPEECPLCQGGGQAVKPGSRPATPS